MVLRIGSAVVAPMGSLFHTTVQTTAAPTSFVTPVLVRFRSSSSSSTMRWRATAERASAITSNSGGGGGRCGGGGSWGKTPLLLPPPQHGLDSHRVAAPALFRCFQQQHPFQKTAPLLLRPFSFLSLTIPPTTAATSVLIGRSSSSIQRSLSTRVANAAAIQTANTSAASFLPATTTITTRTATPSPPPIMEEEPFVYRKLKPYIVKRRLNRMKTYTGAEQNIRHSPWRLNLVCQLAANLPLPDALVQLQFCTKSLAPLVQTVLTRTANLADIRDGLQPSQLEVAECFATKGSHLKRMKTMGRGRTGRMEHKHAHFRVVLRQIDFKLKVYQARTLHQKKKWVARQHRAELDAARVQQERRELEQLERQAAANRSQEKN